MALRYDEIADLIKIIDASACEELILETSEIKLVVRRTIGASASTTPSPTPASSPRMSPTVATLPQATQPVSVQAGPTGPAAPMAEASQGITVRAPMVGTFYRAPSPDAPPFVEVGSTVAKGDPLCVIEVMKLFTTIYAEAAGRVAQICAANAEFVEYDRVLFVLEG